MDKPAGSGPVFRGSNPLRGTSSISNVQFTNVQLSLSVIH